MAPSTFIKFRWNNRRNSATSFCHPSILARLRERIEVRETGMASFITMVGKLVMSLVVRRGATRRAH
jgi:hypothetical protein